MGVLLFPVFLIVGVLQIWLGYVGISHHLGTIAAVLAIFLAFGLRILLPLTIGSFFGAMNVMGWPWWVALMVALPGLLFIAPAMIMAAIEPILARNRG